VITVSKEFDAWMAKLDDYLERKVGLRSADLADWPFYDEWEAGSNPRDVADQMLVEEGWEE
jgi:hypothetical protein